MSKETAQYSKKGSSVKLSGTEAKVQEIELQEDKGNVDDDDEQCYENTALIGERVYVCTFISSFVKVWPSFHLIFS